MFEEPENLVSACPGNDPFGVVLNVLDQALLIVTHAEEVVLLFHELDGAFAVRTEVLGPNLPLRPVSFFLDAVPAAVHVVVDLSLGPEPLENRADDADVLRLGRPDEAIERDVQVFPGCLEGLRHLVGEFDRSHVPLGRGLLHLLAVLVGPRQKADLGAGLPIVPGQRVGEHGCIGVPKMGIARSVVDRGREISTVHVGVVGGVAETSLLSSSRDTVRRSPSAERSVTVSCKISTLTTFSSPKDVRRILPSLGNRRRAST